MTRIANFQTTPHYEIEVIKDSDRLIKVLEHRPTTHSNGNGDNNGIIEQTAILKVNSKTLLECSPYFKSIMCGCWREGSEPIILEQDKIKSVEIWMRHFHGTLDEIAFDSVSVKDIWHLIKTGDKYQFNLLALSSWFEEWYKTQDPRDYIPEGGVGVDSKVDSGKQLLFERQMVFPCYAFRYRAGYTAVTKTLVYDMAGHVTEKNPDYAELSALHLPSRVIQQMNAARGRLRNLLHRYIFEEVKSIVEGSSCRCKESVTFYYLRELRRIEIWPMEEIAAKTSIKEMLSWANQFDERKMRANISNAPHVTTLCAHCDRPWGSIVKDAHDKISKYFDGLCLHCMDKDKSIVIDGNRDDDYWYHDYERMHYDIGCGVRHAGPTWYFSFMGRREKKELIADYMMEKGFF